jgi:hypothetical protein
LLRAGIPGGIGPHSIPVLANRASPKTNFTLGQRWATWASKSGTCGANRELTFGGEKEENMKQEMCFKFLEHLYNYSSGILKKEHISDVDITYINNEVDNFFRRLILEEAATYDKTGVLSKVEKIKEETTADKAANLSKMLLKSRFKLFGALFGTKDDAHIQRFNKITEFKERIKKVIVILEFGGTLEGSIDQKKSN